MSGGPGPNRDLDLLVHIAEAEEDESKHDKSLLGSKRTFDEWECPVCEAYNPHSDFGDGDEIICAYCGIPFEVEVTDEGKLKLTEK
jgi:hypothetical protein